MCLTDDGKRVQLWHPVLGFGGRSCRFHASSAVLPIRVPTGIDLLQDTQINYVFVSTWPLTWRFLSRNRLSGFARVLGTGRVSTFRCDRTIREDEYTQRGSTKIQNIVSAGKLVTS